MFSFSFSMFEQYKWTINSHVKHCLRNFENFFLASIFLAIAFQFFFYALTSQSKFVLSKYNILLQFQLPELIITVHHQFIATPSLTSAPTSTQTAFIFIRLGKCVVIYSEKKPYVIHSLMTAAAHTKIYSCELNCVYVCVCVNCSTFQIERICKNITHRCKSVGVYYELIRYISRAV